MTGLEQLDEVRLEWEYEAVKREHEGCCVGALLVRFEDGPRWINVLAPVESENYRSFADDE
jgi:hypothetical protein